MEKGKITDLPVIIVIVGLGLFTAYITFGILESQASADVKKYKLGGAIAGALVTISMLLSAYRGFRRSSGEVEKLRDRIQELSQKIIRGAPCPKGFEIEVDERQRLVLAKPAKWQPRGGTLFDFELPKEKLLEGDIFPARLQVTFGPLDLGGQTIEQLYENSRKTFENNPYVGSFTSEFITVGGEPSGVKSLKIIFQVFGQIRLTEDAVTHKEVSSSYWLPKETFEQESAKALASAKGDKSDATNDLVPSDSSATPTTSPTAPSTRDEYRKIWQMKVICLHEDLQKSFVFDFYDDENDFTVSSALFNQVLSSVRFLT